MEDSIKNRYYYNYSRRIIFSWYGFVELHIGHNNFPFRELSCLGVGRRFHMRFRLWKDGSAYDLNPPWSQDQLGRSDCQRWELRTFLNFRRSIASPFSRKCRTEANTEQRVSVRLVTSVLSKLGILGHVHILCLC